jgi:SAM-dependent methyltransferase
LLVPKPVQGNWKDFYEDMLAIGKQFRPKSMLDLGCGFFIGLDAIAQAGSLERYVGVDARPYGGQVEVLVAEHPSIDIKVVHADVSTYVPDGHYDLVVIDAHGSVPDIWMRVVTNDLQRVKEAQCEIAKACSPNVIVMDDCAVEIIGNVALNAFGQPTGKSDGLTSLWWWKL